MNSAFGIDHGDVKKSLGGAAKELAGTAKLGGRSFKQSYKLGRLHGKKALAEAGYPTKPLQSIKESFKTGMNGTASGYRSGQKKAISVGRDRVKRDINALSRGQKPGSTLSESMSDSRKLMSARIDRTFSQARNRRIF